MPARGKATAGRMSLRAFGRRRDVSLTAVQKAIRSGRLRKSVGRDGRGPFIVDAKLADREWSAGASKAANGGGHKPTPGAAAAPAPVGDRAPADGTLVAAQLRLADQRAAALELANKRKRGEVLDAALVEREQFEAARMVRERVLNVPDRLPDLGAAMVARLREELRLALAGVADELDRGE